jgi:hypothetical protein
MDWLFIIFRWSSFLNNYLEVAVRRSAGDQDVLECAEEEVECAHPYRLQKLGQANDYWGGGLLILGIRSEGDDLKVDFRELARLQVQFHQGVTSAQFAVLVDPDLRSVSAYDEDVVTIYDWFELS